MLGEWPGSQKACTALVEDPGGAAVTPTSADLTSFCSVLKVKNDDCEIHICTVIKSIMSYIQSAGNCP